jgi:hypothetical protein
MVIDRGEQGVLACRAPCVAMEERALGRHGEGRQDQGRSCVAIGVSGEDRPVIHRLRR